MPPYKTYGKRQTAQERLNASIFASDSSPLKAATPVRALRETPERRKRGTNETLEVEMSASVHGGLAEIREVVERLGRLDIVETGHDRNENTETSKLVQGAEDRPKARPLSDRDVNAAAKTPRRRRKIVSSSPAADEQTALARSLVPTSKLRSPKIEESQHVIDPAPAPATPSPRRRRLVRCKRRLSSTPTAPAAEHENENPLSAYSKPLLELCTRPSITPFAGYAARLAQHFKISKIAEASYGEVYRLSLAKSHSSISSSDKSVLKIVALKPAPCPRGTIPSPADLRRAGAMSAVPDVANEVRLLQHMTPIPGFTNFRCLTVVQGRLPQPFVKAWRFYHQHVKRSLFPDPARKANYGDEQLWAVLEMQDAGRDVESLIEQASQCSPSENDGDEGPVLQPCISAPAVWDIFWGVAGAVAKGEEWAGFEHRDLHIGNICVKQTRTDLPAGADLLNTSASLLDTTRTLGYTGLEATIIDYTLSRAEISTTEGTADVAFFDLSKDAAIFEGDAAEEYQYEIYRYMRAAVLHGDPASVDKSLSDNATKKKGRRKACKTPSDDELAKQRDAWRAPHRLTNLVWLHFVLTKLTEALLPSLAGDTELEEQLRSRLERLSELLTINTMAQGKLQSGADLVGWAVAKAWLREEDVLGLGAGS